MSYTTQQHMANRIAHAYGYKIAEGIQLSEFTVGEGIIVLNKNGEPLNSGLIEKLYKAGDEDVVEVNGSIYPSSCYSFRKL